MKKIYFDQNVWHDIVEKLTVNQFSEKLSSKQMEICLGPDNIYEFAKSFLNDKDQKLIHKGQTIFQYLRDIGITYFIDGTEKLVESDLVYARTGGRLLPCLDPVEVVLTKEEISHLAEGKFDNVRTFIYKMEGLIIRHTPKYRKDIINSNIKVPRPSDFYVFRDNWSNRRKVLDKSEFREKSQYISDSILFSNPEKFPFLNTYINAQLYFNFIALTNPNGPSKRLIWDYRHLITANASDVFVTNDKKLILNSMKLCPYIKISKWVDFCTDIAITP